jgi:SAM-dependent methyltransferase
MSHFKHNSETWDKESIESGRWSRPVSSQEVKAARDGRWSIVLTPVKAVPRSWFPKDMNKVKVLLVAGGGGQQTPIIAATGAETHIIDGSQEQLNKDLKVAGENSLVIHTLRGDMTDLSHYEDGTFDLLINPCSNCFISDVNPLWRECFRVLKTGGKLMSGSLNPIWFASDQTKQEKGIFEVIHSIPFKDTENSAKHHEFGHSLNDLIGGQLRVGFKIVDFYEDGWGDKNLDKYLHQYIATLAEK